MLFTTVGQYRVFLWMMAAGALMGAWYAATAALRRLLSAGLWLGLMADAAFGLGAAAIFCAALFTANYGELRLYEAVAAALGFSLFALGAYPPGRRAFRALKAFACRIVVKIGRFRWIKVIFR